MWPVAGLDAKLKANGPSGEVRYNAMEEVVCGWVRCLVLRAEVDLRSVSRLIKGVQTNTFREGTEFKQLVMTLPPKDFSTI